MSFDDTSSTRTLDDATIRDLIGFTDPKGVLSFYAGNTPEKAADPQPTAPIEIRNQLKSLRGRLGDADRDLARAVEQRLGGLDRDLDGLLDPKAPGRGRALFVGVEEGATARVALQIPFRERVVHDRSAYVRPLVAALDEGRPAGILVLSRGGTRLLRWALGEAEMLDETPFVPEDDVLAGEKSGPSPGNPEHPHHGFVDRERYEDRVEEHRHRFLRDAAGSALQRAEREGWDRLVVSAPPKLRDLAGELGPVNGLPRVLLADQAWEDAPPHEIAGAAWGLLRSVHEDRERELVTAAKERALGGGAGALGLRHVCAALNEGRVEHLLYDESLELEGFVSDEGTLHPRVEGIVAASDVPLKRDPLFVERLLEKAITTSAAVTPVGGDRAALLAEHEGVAATLRW